MTGCMPMVLTTTPPQPASKARMMFESDSVGGADASRNGFSNSMPVKRVDSVLFMMPPGSRHHSLFPVSNAAHLPPRTVLTSAHAQNGKRRTDPGEGRHLSRGVDRRRQEADDRQAPAARRGGRQEGGPGPVSPGAFLRTVF